MTTNNSDYYIYLVLAHTIVYEQRVEGVNLQCKSTPQYQTSPSESTANMMQAMTQYLPGYLQSVGSQVLPLEQQLQDASATISPQVQQQQLDLYNKYGPQLNAVGADIAKQNALAQTSADKAVMEGPGQDLVKSNLELSKLQDPEYYAMRAQEAQKFGDLLGSYNMNGLSGSERSEVERSLNRDNANRGTYNTPSQTSTVENAMQFGSALDAKRTSLGNALNAATQFLPSSKSGVDTFQIATGKSSTGNTGESKFTGVQDLSKSNAFSSASDLLGNVNSAQGNAMNTSYNTRLSPVWEGANQVFAGCCFIMMEAYNGTLPPWIRAARDMHYANDPAVAKGYINMSRWLVPLMQRYAIVRNVVNTTMIQPLSKHGKWLFGYSEKGEVYKYSKTFWFSVWKLIAKLS